MKIDNYKKMLASLSDDKVVLDIGAWERPFNRADYVLDILPYETRKVNHAYPDNMPERFTKDTWVEMDFSNKKLPFADKQFDFVICGHVVEDIKDPAALCREIMRIGKAGYFEFPARAWEMKNSVDPYLKSYNYVGYCHHRWMVQGAPNAITFSPKTTTHSVVKSLRTKKVEHMYDFLFWNGSFEINEKFFSSFEEIINEALEFKSNNDGMSLQTVRNKYRLERWLFNVPSQILNRLRHRNIPE